MKPLGAELTLRLFREDAVLLQPDAALLADLKAIPGVLELAVEITGMPVAILARITETRWVALAVLDTIGLGLHPGLVIDPIVTLCQEVRKTGEPVGFSHASQDPRFSSHPLPRTYGIESYLAVPVVLPGGKYFGNLCLVGTQPSQPITPSILGRVQLLADLVARQINEDEMSLDALTQERQAHSAIRLALESEREMGRRLEQVLAMVGHDLRNPLASIVGGAHALQQPVEPGRAADIVARIYRSAERMVTLVDDLLDVERARLCGEIGVRPHDVPDIAPMLRHVVEEISHTCPERVIELHFEGLRAAPCRCDPARIGQLLSNLVKNALDHGEPALPVTVRVELDAEGFTIEVCNHGEPIPEARRHEMFEPFLRRDARTRQHGLGVGLFIVKKIAEGHGGGVRLDSDADGTCVSVRIPCPSSEDGE